MCGYPVLGHLNILAVHTLLRTTVASFKIPKAGWTR